MDIPPEAKQEQLKKSATTAHILRKNMYHLLGDLHLSKGRNLPSWSLLTNLRSSITGVLLLPRYLERSLRKQLTI